MNSLTAPFARPQAVKPKTNPTQAPLPVQHPKPRKRSQYAGAKTGRLTNPLIANVSYDINSLIASSGAKLKARVQQLQRDFPHIYRAINAGAAFVIGDGIKFQSRVTDNKGNLNSDINTRIESAFNFWAEQADASGKLHYYEIQDLLKRQDLETGEFFAIKRFKKYPNQYVPYSLEIHEAEILDTSMDNYGYSKGGTEIRLGIEYVKTSGRPVAYYIRDEWGFGKGKRIPADLIIHNFKMIRPEQLRGITPFASGIMLASNLEDFMGATLDSAKMAAKHLGAVVSKDPMAAQLGMSEADTDYDLRVEEIENAIFTYLNEGEDIKFSSNPNPGDNFPPYVRLLLSMLSITSGIPYEILTGDYSGYTYVNLRVSRNDFFQFLKPEYARFIRHFCIPTTRDFMDAAVLSGKLNLPGYATDPFRYYRSEWQPPGIESIDPLKETKANIDQLKSNLVSPQELAKRRGRDLEQIYQEIAQAKAMQEQYGITDEEVSTALANAPSAVVEQDNG
jgi:lambda family phage portal protein